MIDDKRKDLKRLLLLNLGALAFAIAFSLVAILMRRVTFPYVYCLTYSLARLYCPFCGGTRALFELMTLDFLSVLKYNAFLLYLIAAFVFFDIRAAILILKGRKGAFTVPKWLKILTVCIGVAYFVVRNLMLIAFDIDPIGDLLPFWENL